MEVNARVNYPIKNALLRMEENNLIDMEFENAKHCVSAVTLIVARVGMQKVVQSWNNQTVPGNRSVTNFFSIFIVYSINRKAIVCNTFN